MVSLISLPFLQDTKVAQILGIAESSMQSAYISDVAEPANDLITKMGSDEWYKGYKSILTLPSSEYVWKKGYPIKSFHSVILHRTNLYPVAKRMSGSTRPIYMLRLVRRSPWFFEAVHAETGATLLELGLQLLEELWLSYGCSRGDGIDIDID